MEFTKVIEERYACKSFDGKPVPEEDLRKILEAGRLAPTAKNAQPCHVYVAQSDEALAKVDAVTPCRYNAKTVLIVTSDRNKVFQYPGGRWRSTFEDAAIIGTHLMLAAADLGVNSCWLNNFNPDVATETFDLMKNETVVLMLDLGYADENGKPLEKHFSRKDLSETVTFL